MAFTGFSTDQLVGLPPELFTQVLPDIVLASELKVTLHVFYCLSRQQGSPRRICWDDLAADHMLMQGLRSLSRQRSPLDLLEEGIDAATRRGTLLHLALPGESRTINWYLAHTAANRAWAAQMHQARAVLAPNPTGPARQPGLIALYEQNIGLVTPLLVEELREAEATYPAAWLEEAIREAVRANARSWRYIRKVLERWAAHGRQTEQPGTAAHHTRRLLDVERYLDGPYAHLFQRGDRQPNNE